METASVMVMIGSSIGVAVVYGIARIFVEALRIGGGDGATDRTQRWIIRLTTHAAAAILIALAVLTTGWVQLAKAKPASVPVATGGLSDVTSKGREISAREKPEDLDPSNSNGLAFQ
jgi:hypothetical protein